MSKQTSASSAAKAGDKLVVLYGVDEDGKSRAAKFTPAQADLARKAAQLMSLECEETNAGALGDLADKIPSGRIYSNGRGAIPYVRRERYLKVLQRLGKPLPLTGLDVTPIGYPSDWESIDVGHTVVAHFDAQTGWWPAITVKVEGDMLTLQWCDEPRRAKIQRHRAAVALLKPSIA